MNNIKSLSCEIGQHSGSTLQIFKAVSEELFGFNFVFECDNEESNISFKYLKTIYFTVLWINKASVFEDFELRKKMIKENQIKGHLFTNPDSHYKESHFKRFEFIKMKSQAEKNKKHTEYIKERRAKDKIYKRKLAIKGKFNYA